MKKSITGNNANHAGIKLLIFIVYNLVLINYSYSACLLKQSSRQAELRVPSINFQLKSPESEFIIEIMIRKGSIKGMARYEQKLPPGFFAIPIETHGGKFTFKNQKVKIIWMQLPEQNSFMISYTIKVYKDLSEILFINCKLQCVVDKHKITFRANKRLSSIPDHTVVVYLSAKGGKGNKYTGRKVVEVKVQNVKGMFGKECYPDKRKSKYNKM